MLSTLKKKYGKGGGIRRVLDLNDPKLASPEADTNYKGAIEGLKKRLATTKTLDLNDPSLPSRRKEVGKPSPAEPLGTSSRSPQEILTRVIPTDPAGRSQLQTELHQLIMGEPNTASKLRALQRMNQVIGDNSPITEQDLVQYMQSFGGRGGGFGKGGAIKTLSRLMNKYEGDTPRPVGGPPAAGPAPAKGPLFVDSYGQQYNSPEELVEGVRNAVEEEADEPRWTDAAQMLQKIPGSEPAQQALAGLMKAYDDPKANFDQALTQWTQAFESIAKPAAPMAPQGGPPPAFAKGGRAMPKQSIKSARNEQRKARNESAVDSMLGKLTPEYRAEFNNRRRARVGDKYKPVQLFGKGGAVRPSILSPHWKKTNRMEEITEELRAAQSAGNSQKRAALKREYERLREEVGDSGRDMKLASFKKGGAVKKLKRLKAIAAQR